MRAALVACWRTAGSSGLPIRWPSRSSAKLTREPAPPSSGSTLTSALSRIGPSTPRTAQLLGGRSSVTSSSPTPTASAAST
jgi:hypothetical protein